MAGDGGNEGGDRALHVDCAAAVKGAVANFTGEGIDAPGSGVAHRQHVRVPGIAEVGAYRTKAGVEIVDRRAVVLGKAQEGDGDAELVEHRLHNTAANAPTK